MYVAHTRPWFVGLVAHGSAVKGGFISGCSDIDLQLFLDDAAFAAVGGADLTEGRLSLNTALAIQRELADIDPAPFGYVQCYVFPPRLPDGWTGPVSGAWRLIAGNCPLPEATAGELRAAAQAHLRALDPLPRGLQDELLGRSAARLARHVRLLTTEVWPALYNLLVLRDGDPMEVWNLMKQQAIERTAADEPVGREIRAFYEAMLGYYPAQVEVDRALAMIEHGVAFLHAVKRTTTG